MSGKCADIVGLRFGRLTVEKRAGSSASRESTWMCRCDCGNTTVARVSSLRNGHTKSCGCLQKERASEVKAHTKHGGYGTRLYSIWSGMKQRCQNKNRKGYSRYGARGVTVCDEWQSFEPFRDWSIANGYADTLSIDRIDNGKGYSPENCRWVTWKEQQNNRTSNRKICFNGKTKTLSQWAEISGISADVLRARIVDLNWPIEQAITTPVHRTNVEKEI